MTSAVAAIAILGSVGLRPQADTPGAAQDGGMVIPFRVGPATCTDRARLYVVSMRVYNVLAQPVSIPTLVPDGGPDPVPPAAAGRPLSRLLLPCGRYAAHWSGRHMSTGRRLAPGVYVVELVIDGQRITRKVTLER